VLLELGRHSFDVSTHALTIARCIEGAEVGSADAVLVDGDTAMGETDVPLVAAASHAETARALLSKGVSLVEAGALADPMVLPEIADAGASAWISHRSGTVDQVSFLHERARWAEAAGLARSRIVVEASLDRVAEVAALGYPVLVSIEDHAGARGSEVAAVMGGARIVVSNRPKQTRRTLFTIGELLARRGVEAPRAVEPLGCS